MLIKISFRRLSLFSEESYFPLNSFSEGRIFSFKNCTKEDIFLLTTKKCCFYVTFEKNTLSKTIQRNCSERNIICNCESIIRESCFVGACKLSSYCERLIKISTRSFREWKKRKKLFLFLVSRTTRRHFVSLCVVEWKPFQSFLNVVQDARNWI